MSNGSFLDETNASNKQSELVKKLTATWEKKNTKAARAGGASLMALSLAACGGDDNTPFSQADVTAAEEAATAAAIAADTTPFAQADVDAAAAAATVAAQESVTEAQADAAAALVAQQAAEATAAAAQVDAATALVAQQAAETSAAAATVALTAAQAAQATAEADKTAAEAAQATAEADLLAAQASLATAQSDLTAKTAEYDTLVASNATLQDSYDALVAPKALTLTAATAGETLIGGSGADTFSGDKDSIDANDTITDATDGDGDVANLSDNGDLDALTISNVETVNVTVASTAAGTTTVDAANFSGVDVLNITRADVTVGSSTIAGNKSIVVANMDANDVAKVVAGAGTTTMNVTQATTTGATVDADNASGAVQVLGSGVIDAANATSVVAGGIGTALQDANAITINAAKATTVNVGSATAGTAFDNTAITGAITINAAAATQVNAAASGGITVDAKGGTTGVILTAIDDSGASVTTSYVGTSTAAGVVNVDGSGTADVATVSAAGNVTLTTNASDQIETVNLSGNGAAATYAVTGAATTYNLTGSQNVTLAGDEASFDGKTISDNTTGTTTLNITTLNDSDLSKAGVDNILVSSNVASKTLTVASDATVTLGTDVTTAIAVAGKTASATVNIATADDTAASGATIDIQTGTLTLSSNIATANIDASVGKLTMATATTLASTAALNVSGTKDVALGAVTAKSLDASASSGKISGSFAAVTSVKTGTGVDTLAFDDSDSATTVFSLEAGDGNDIITVEDAAEASSFDLGAGNDQITIGSATSSDAETSVVVVGGLGDDTINVAADIDSDAILVGGDGSDTLALKDTDGNDFSGNANFAISGFETVDISTLTSGAIKISAAQFAGENSFKLSGNAVADEMHIANTGTAGTTIDASNITHDATQASTLRLEGKALLADTVMGSAKDDIIVATSGGDTIDGSTGTDTFLAASLAAATVEGAGTGTSTGVVINLGGTTAVTNTAVLGASVGYTGNSVTSVAAGEYAYVHAASAAINSNVKGSITNVENVTGTGGADYIVGTNGANVIDSGVGNDTIDAGLGADTITGGAGVDTISLGASDAVADTVTIANKAHGSDVIKQFEKANDILKFIDGTDLAILGSATKAFVIDDAADAIAGATIAATDNVIVLTDAVTNNTAGGIQTAIAAIHAGKSAVGDGVIVVAAAATGNAKVWYDAAVASADSVELFELDGVVLADLAALTTDNFVIA